MSSQNALWCSVATAATFQKLCFHNLYTVLLSHNEEEQRRLECVLAYCSNLKDSALAKD